MYTDYDIGIIGGGLAGLSLALLAAEAGYSVVLFEKENYPFHKVCGEYISYESYDFLNRLGLPFPDWKLPSIRKLVVSDLKGNGYQFKLDLGGFGISRYAIDHFLYLLALQKGVQVFTNEKVNDVRFEKDIQVIHTNREETTVKIAAGAYGKRSNLDVKWERKFAAKKMNKLNNYIGIKYHIKTAFPKDTIALHNFKDGYCGISAVEKDKYCLCYLTNASNLSANNNSITQMQENILYKNAFLKKIFTESEYLYNAPLTISQISFERKTQVEDHVLLLGDAAGMITPLCGNGMSMAMHSAKLAFIEMNNFLQQKISRNEMERNYSSNWKKQFAARLRTGRMVQRWMGNEFSTGMFLKIMSKFPVLSKAIIRSTHGKSY
ncbi:MAG TPA: FAD-dependent oxidoreductase [Parafilimonas sp.]|nr:FAD-dependent oxidoreductase [Parafilimonas sp.]